MMELAWARLSEVDVDWVDIGYASKIVNNKPNKRRERMGSSVLNIQAYCLKKRPL